MDTTSTSRTRWSSGRTAGSRAAPRGSCTTPSTGPRRSSTGSIPAPGTRPRSATLSTCRTAISWSPTARAVRSTRSIPARSSSNRSQRSARATRSTARPSTALRPAADAGRRGGPRRLDGVIVDEDLRLAQVGHDQVALVDLQDVDLGAWHLDGHGRAVGQAEREPHVPAQPGHALDPAQREVGAVRGGRAVGGLGHLDVVGSDERLYGGARGPRAPLGGGGPGERETPTYRESPVEERALQDVGAAHEGGHE